MNLPRIPFAALWFALVLSTAGSGRADDLPPSPSPHYVFDEPHWLSDAGFNALDTRLEAFERETSNQLVVAIFRKLPDHADDFDFSQRVFSKWRPGLKEKDNGVILFVFAEDRKLRIHTGYGLEGALPDARCKQIISNEIVPRLKSNDREAAIRAGVEAIIAATKGEYKGGGRTRREVDSDRIDWWFLIGIILLSILLQLFRRKNPDDVYTESGRFSGWGGSWGGGGGGFGDGGFSGGGGSSGGGGAGGSW